MLLHDRWLTPFHLPMFTGQEILATLLDLGISHVVWVPDSSIGPWEEALESSSELRLIRVCREGEAWPLAAGLHLGGRSPLVLMQTTGLFESGDALRNVLFDLNLPILALIGVRNWLVPGSSDSARRFAEPILQAWGVEHTWICAPAERPKLAEHFRDCGRTGRPRIALLAEGPT
jgi:sulfopyruvate decarboxylase subunit alpha